tara:strand:+ start:36544 stop:37098 length:555 start_codon:yes stop_codon:yes gene_type:complete
MKNIIATAAALLALSSCTSITPQAGYRNARGYEAGTGYQLGAGARVSEDLGPVSLEGSVMSWTDHGGENDQFVNRSTTDIESDAVQFSAGASVPVMSGDGWDVALGAGVAYQRSRIGVNLSYAGTYSDTAEEWTAYGELAFRRDNGLMVALRLDESLDVGAQSVFTTDPGGRGATLLIGWTFGN